MFRRLVVAVSLVAILVGSGVVGYSWWVARQIAAIPRFDPVGTPSTSPSPEVVADPSLTSMLVFSVGSKGLDESDGDRLGIGRGRARMGDGLTDSIMLVLANPSTRGVVVISIPRDTYIISAGRRINAAYNIGGVQALVDDVAALTGVRAQHQVALNFAAFADTVDAAGGIDLVLPSMARDVKAKLSITKPGCVRLNGPDALAFARSRNWQVSTDGLRWSTDSTSSDWGRVERQQAVVRAVVAKLAGPQIVTAVPGLLDAAHDNLTLDDGLDLSRMLSLAAAWRSGADEILSSTYPGRGRTLKPSGAQVILPEVFVGSAMVAELAARIGFTVDPALVDTSLDSSTMPATTPRPQASGTPGSTAVPTIPVPIPTATPIAADPSQARSSTAVTNRSATVMPVTPIVTTSPSPRSSADNGLGRGGTRYPVCSGGHPPR